MLDDLLDLAHPDVGLAQRRQQLHVRQLALRQRRGLAGDRAAEVVALKQAEAGRLGLLERVGGFHLLGNHLGGVAGGEPLHERRRRRGRHAAHVDLQELDEWQQPLRLGVRDEVEREPVAGVVQLVARVHDLFIHLEPAPQLDDRLARRQERRRLAHQQVAGEVEERRFALGQRVEAEPEDHIGQPSRTGGFGRLALGPGRRRGGFPVEELVSEHFPRCVEDRLTAHEYGFWSVYVDLHASHGIGPGGTILSGLQVGGGLRREAKGCGPRTPPASGPAGRPSRRASEEWCW